jgi:glutamate N-acetyltransferase/amino-acid N-acetyltransferase
VTSTGVIGMQLDLACFARGVPEVAGQLGADGFEAVSRAMMTTDTVPKTAVRTVTVGGRPVRLLGLAKGAGMIMPNMATLLAFVVTDAAVASAADLQVWLRAGADRSFNRITVDGDTSTNDTLLLLANGLAENPPLAADSPDLPVFREVLDDLLDDLAMQVVADGEGATKLVTIAVQGAVSDDEATIAARTIANSALVKTAFFGEDANWGRIIAALGRSGARFNPEHVAIRFDDVVMVENGLGQGAAAEARATAVLKQKRFTVGVDLKVGNGAALYHTCDFSMDYVSINADYRS